MNNAFEPVLAALFSHLQAAVTVTFTANATAGSAVLANVSNFSGLFVGLPVFGPGVVRGATIQSLNAGAKTITLSDAMSAAGTGVSFTTGFQTADRRVQHWSQVSAQPAMFLRKTGTTDHYSGEMSITTLECEVWIYSNAGKNPNAAPGVTLDNLEQLVRQSFAPDDDFRFTLGGQAYWCRIEGRTDSSPGDQGGQAIAKIPVRITLP